MLEWSFNWNLLHHKFHGARLPAAFGKGFTNFGWRHHFMAIQRKACLAAFTHGIVVKGGSNCWCVDKMEAITLIFQINTTHEQRFFILLFIRISLYWKHTDKENNFQGVNNTQWCLLIFNEYNKENRKSYSGMNFNALDAATDSEPRQIDSLENQ